jgi:hypothetical protein
MLGLLAACRQKMSNQPRYDPYAESDFFPDGISARPLPNGVIPIGPPKDEQLEEGTVNGKAATNFPFPVTAAVMKRGQERFNIFCTPCHDHMGTGQGIVVRRGFYRHPPSFHIDRLRKEAPGYFVDVMTYGFGAMPSYARQIPATDRWAIVAYIRALQLSENATTADVEPDALKTLESEKQ